MAGGRDGIGGGPPEPSVTRERRGEARIPVDGRVMVFVEACRIPGPSKDISRRGLYFVTGERIRVEVRFEDGSSVPGTLVRLGTIRDGETGIAIQFDHPLPDEKLAR